MYPGIKTTELDELRNPQRVAMEAQQMGMVIPPAPASSLHHLSPAWHILQASPAFLPSHPFCTSRCGL